MNIVIRTDSSTAIGTGHVMRCLTLARELRDRDAEVSFVCRDLPGNIAGMIAQEGFALFLLPYEEAPAVLPEGEYARWLGVPVELDAAQTEEIVRSFPSVDRLVVDHYALDAAWERTFRPLVQEIVVIDDLANRYHDCDVLLDQNLHERPFDRYRDLTPPSCRALIGPQFALLREEFAASRRTANPRNGVVRRLLVFYGGADATNETGKAIAALQRLDARELTFDIVIGRANPHRDSIRQAVGDDRRFTTLEDVTGMASLMASADLALGAGGTTTWERCCLGLPTLVTAVAENQIPIAREADRAGAVSYLGTWREVTVDGLVGALTDALSSPPYLSEISRRGMELVDGQGAVRVTQIILSSILTGVAL